MSKIEVELRNQLEENISAHKNILDMSKDISDVIQNIYNGSYYILKIFEKTEFKQIKDIKIESNEIENDFILLKLSN